MSIPNFREYILQDKVIDSYYLSDITEEDLDLTCQYVKPSFLNQSAPMYEEVDILNTFGYNTYFMPNTDVKGAYKSGIPYLEKAELSDSFLSYPLYNSEPLFIMPSNPGWMYQELFYEGDPETNETITDTFEFKNDTIRDISNGVNTEKIKLNLKK